MAQAVVSVRDHQLHALEPALHQALQEACPERLGFGRPDAKADDLAPAVDVRRHRDYRGDRLLAGDVARGFLRRIVSLPQVRRLSRASTSRSMAR